ncbi:pyridine nucleotide-disulfide oxidoreductase [Thermanaerosceptrum fracticalcis]|uniref:Pyridine nucleotide-disulfide oxidoreductase n=1 Tax=Thermanaerosceptrum fracticalcis TaxID=1712410 RepID=A0A7G6E1Z7_THEFR|nr:FAD-dependent oxidoreductase [Thermanaerosceptrum fracticalcis]QNB46101.1 pyridine nucleotide-disulfide oxidoreductase [Thermanaerosceptrum fracticalcis]
MTNKYVIIGGVACGPKVAARLRRLDLDAEITIIEKGEILSYGGCGMPYYISDEVHDIKELWSTPVGVPRDVQFFKKVKNIEIMDRTLAQKINRTEKKVEVVRLETGEVQEISYDKLVLAVGGTPVDPPIPGKNLNNVYKLNHPYDAEGIKKAVGTGKIKNAVIVGGGLIGLEVAESLTKLGIKVVIVEMLDRVLPKMLDIEMASLLMHDMRVNGVDISVNNKVLSFEGDDQGNLKAVVTEQGTIEAQLALVSIGVRPNSKLAQEAGLEITDNDAIKVNEYLQTTDPDIYAGGDCVDNYHLILKKRVYTPLGDLANIHGRIIANNIAGTPEEFPGVLGTTICRVFDFNAGSVGLTEERARELHYDVVTVLAPGPDKAHFYPTAKTIFIKLVGNKKDGKIIGAQVIGPGDVAKRLNMLSLGLYYGITAKEMAKMDLAYAPPFAPAMDNLITAANIIQNKIDGIAKSISVLDVKKKLENNEDFILLDVRSPKEVEEMSLPYKNVVYIPLGVLREKYDQLPRDKEIIIFCKVSLRGYEAQRILEEKGFTNIKFMDGGIVSWPFERSVKK